MFLLNYFIWGGNVVKYYLGYPGLDYKIKRLMVNNENTFLASSVLVNSSESRFKLTIVYFYISEFFIRLKYKEKIWSRCLICLEVLS